MVKDSKLYIYIDILENSIVDYFMANKVSNFKVSLNGKFCALGKMEPCDSYLVKMRNLVKLSQN
jgi:hypothetical protein